MNNKFALLVPGAIALALSLAPMLPISAQQNPNAPMQQRGQGRGSHDKIMEQLNLTDAQKAQLKKIHEETRAKMDAVLTADQKAEMQRARQERRKPNLNLTEAQKAQMKTIREEAKRRMDAVLTAEQKQKLDELRQQHKQQRGQQGQMSPQ
ncbi:MAG: Spy/CpxP family protein refolding chaperone [Scytolyngbya sp. HA4215-MV1]|jgi:Spy/CpxP family protein refolding chaperone|nr:Spy/CpxP family protein refolding chaperone [Scytolyngbya sp. HA4215-MV1]